MKREMTDDELIMLIRSGSEEAKDELLERNKSVIDFYLKKYRSAAYGLNIEINDLEQEALLGFSDSIGSYDSSKASNFKTFSSQCVNRRLLKAIVKGSRQKNINFLKTLSLDVVTKGSDTSLAELISDNNVNNPLEKLTKEEDYNNLITEIRSELSDKEKEIFELMLAGFGLIEITSMLNSDKKSTYNTATRVRNKIKKILENKK